MSNTIPKIQVFDMGGVSIYFKLNEATNEYLVSSKDIADLFDRENNSVMRSIDYIDKMDEEIGYNDGAPSTRTGCSYLDGNDRERPAIMMDERTVIMTIRGMQGKKSYKYMSDFQHAYVVMRKVINDNMNYIQEDSVDEMRELEMYNRNMDEYYTRIAAEHFEEVAIKEKEEMEKKLAIANETIKYMTPDYEYGCNVKISVNELTMSEWSKHFKEHGIQISNQRLIRWLKANGYMQVDKNIAYQQHINAGLFRTITESLNGGVYQSMVVTPAGVAALNDEIQTSLNMC